MDNPRLAVNQSWILHEAIAGEHDVVLSPILNQADPEGIARFLGPGTRNENKKRYPDQKCPNCTPVLHSHLRVVVGNARYCSCFQPARAALISGVTDRDKSFP